MYEIFYRTEVNIISLFASVWIIYRSKKIKDKQTRNIMFQRVISSAALLLFIDTILIFTNGKEGAFIYYLNWALNCIYLILNAVVAFTWEAYVRYYIRGIKRSSILLSRIFLIPLFIFLLFVVLSPFNKLIYYIDENNFFCKGPLYFLQIILTYGLFTMAGVVAFVSLLNKKNRPQYYHRYVIFFAFIFFPCLSGVSHLIFPEVKSIWQTISFGFLLVYVEFQFDLISRDALTNLNNRRAFDIKLSQMAAEQNDCSHTYIFMIDINFFKKINDKYGHLEGDTALIKTADILKKVLVQSNAFLCRYGGDEFAIIYNCTNEQAGDVRIKIYKEFEKEFQISDLPYRLSVSVGYAPINGKSKAEIAAAEKAADLNLYNEKAAMHLALEETEEYIKK